MCGNEPSHSQRSFHFGSWNPGGLWMFREWLQGSKPKGSKSSLYHWKSIEMQMSKMGSHHPFGHMKHKLWPKEGLIIKLAIWLPTTKSRESPRFPCVQVVCDILLKSSRQRLQLCFRPYLSWMFAHKVMGPQNRGSPNFSNFGTPTWESRDKKPFGCRPCGEAHSIL